MNKGDDAQDVTAASPRRAARSGRRVSSMPLIEIGRSASKAEALAGFERWKARHPEAAAHVEPADLLVDAMRGRFTTWTRIRVNLVHVPEELRPAQEPLDPDDEPSWGPGPWPPEARTPRSARRDSAAE